MRAVAVVMLVGCGFSPHSSSATSDGNGDGQLGIDAPPGCTSYSTQFDSCAVGSGSNADLGLTGNTKYDTDTNTLTLDDNTTSNPPHVVINTVTGSVDVLFVGAFNLAGKLRVTGTFPFGIAAAGDVTITGTLDLANDGAGARSDSDCKLAQSLGAGGITDTGGGSGGGGGAFQGNGGKGGPSDSDQGMELGGPAGTATSRPPGLLGGCDGGKGGDGNTNSAGKAGDGGGALVIATRGMITIAATGVVDVGGGGGHGGKSDSGGGGGGASAGMILLECGTLQQLGAVVANGGGGGEGAENGNDGEDGSNGLATMMRAPGGSGGAGEGGDGADGGAGATNDGATVTQLKKGGGGGGGGGTGYIAIACTTITNTGTISPAFASWP